MSRKNSGINYSRTAPVRSRRVEALKRLEATLKRGSKKSKDGKELIALSEKDTKRINKEISILQGRL